MAINGTQSLFIFALPCVIVASFFNSAFKLFHIRLAAVFERTAAVAVYEGDDLTKKLPAISTLKAMGKTLIVL